MTEDKNVYIIINAHPKMCFDGEKFHFMEPPIKRAFEDWNSSWKYILDNNKDGLWHVVVEPIQNRTVSKRDSRSWLGGTCKECGYNVIVTQPDVKKYPDCDYWWYCSNKKCKNHREGEHTGDMESPSWVEIENI